MVEVKRLDAGVHSLAKINCRDYNGNTVFQAEYLVTIQKLGEPENDTIQAILNDIGANKRKYGIDTITMYTENDYGERHVFFDMDDCENVLFHITRKERIKQMCENHDRKKKELLEEYNRKFGLLPCTDCGELYAEDILALNEWYDKENKRLVQEWTDAVLKAAMNA